jgi:hypothetical protein
MFTLHTHKKMIFTALLSFAMTATAEPNNPSEIFRCPSIDSIHQATPLLNQIDNDYCEEGYRCIFTGMKPAFHENGLPWGLLSYVKARSEKEAIQKSQFISANASINYSETLTSVPATIVGCLYLVPSADSSENEAMVIEAFIFQDNNDLTSPHSPLNTKFR